MNERLFAATTKTFEKGDVYPGYPTSRLTLDASAFETGSPLVLPDGPWTAKNTNLPSLDESLAFIDAGYQVDTNGRPLHPWLQAMVTNPDVGVVTGKGFYRHWGPNYTADPVVLTKEARPMVLLIQRGDTGVWALPGGFVDPGETDPIMAATRELYEEATLEVPVEGRLIYQGPVADIRTTANSWADTSAYAFWVDGPLPVMVKDPKEVKAVQWFYVDEMPEELHGSHKVLIEMALEQGENSEQVGRKTIREILDTPDDQREVTIVDAGHMAYDHLFVSDGVDRLFVKAHDKERFNDPFREAHSRAYLQKEFTLFTHLAELGYAAIPDRVDLIDDSLLAMDALYEGDGWIWGAPEQGEDFDHYVSDVLGALDALQHMPIPDKPAYHDSINATYETFWKEGWDDISDEKIAPLIDKIRSLSTNWNTDQRNSIEALISDFPSLREQTLTINRHPEFFMAHNDARPSNIGWKPDEEPQKRARLVDWSWADPAPYNADATMFLVDLAKSGRDINKWLDYINKDQLIVYTGFLLAHALWSTRDGSSTIREQQVASASAAHRLLKLVS